MTLSLGKMGFERFRVEIRERFDPFDPKSEPWMREWRVATVSFIARNALNPDSPDLSYISQSLDFYKDVPEEIVIRRLVVQMLHHEVEEWLHDDVTGKRYFNPHEKDGVNNS